MIQYPNFKFEIKKTTVNSKARLGLLKTPHGCIETPNFIFCATKGAMKSITTKELEAANADIMLCNTYHMFVYSAHEIVNQHGGLHKFMNWNKPILTDSGGFQIFSLGHGGVASEIKGSRNLNYKKMLKNIDEMGATFKSYLDGKIHKLTPELSIEIQRKLKADIILVLDECTPFNIDRLYTEASMQRSHSWAKKSLKEFIKKDDNSQCLYGIVQGGIYKDLRQESAQYIANENFFGQAIGGSLGSNKEEMLEVTSLTVPYLNSKKPIHLLGIGCIKDIWNNVDKGIDTFDCVHPMRIARHGVALVTPYLSEGNEYINLKNSCFKEDMRQIEKDCFCYCCLNFTRSYIHYLFKAKEATSGTLLSIHNAWFMSNLMKTIRNSIINNNFHIAKKKWI